MAAREAGCYVRYLNNNNEISFYVEDYGRTTIYYIIPNDKLDNIQYSDYYGYYMYTGIVNELDILSDQSIISSLTLLTSNNEQILLDAIAAYEASQSNESSSNISKSTLIKTINNTTSYIYPKTSVDNIVDDNNNLLSNKLSEIESRLSILEDNSGGGGNIDYTDLLKYIFDPANNTLQDYNISIPSGVTSIDSYAFYKCIYLISISLPSSVTSIGANAFQSCTALTTINIPSSLTSIGASLFNKCTNLKFVTIGNGFNCNNLSLSVSTKYSAETMVGWFNALYDRTGLSAYRLTIGSTNLNKLTAEQKAIATNKNWTLA